MTKNTVTGSILAKLFPTLSKHLLENATQDEVTQAEQEAAVIHQQMNNLGESGPPRGNSSASTPNSPSTQAVVAAAMPLDIPAPQPGANALAEMTTRATTAENQLADVRGQLTKMTQDRDQYKAWFDKQAAAGTGLPKLDATTSNQALEEKDKDLSAASLHAINLVRGR